MTEEKLTLSQRLADLREALMANPGEASLQNDSDGAPNIEAIDFDQLCGCLKESSDALAEVMQIRAELNSAREWFSHRITALTKARGLLAHDRRDPQAPTLDGSLIALLALYQQEMDLLRTNNSIQTAGDRVSRSRKIELLTYRS